MFDAEASLAVALGTWALPVRFVNARLLKRPNSSSPFCEIYSSPLGKLIT